MRSQAPVNPPQCPTVPHGARHTAGALRHGARPFDQAIFERDTPLMEGRSLTAVGTVFGLFLALVATACSSSPPTPTPTTRATVAVSSQPTLEPTPTATPRPTATPTAILRATATPTVTPLPTSTPTPTPTPTPREYSETTPGFVTLVDKVFLTRSLGDVEVVYAFAISDPQVEQAVSAARMAWGLLNDGFGIQQTRVPTMYLTQTQATIRDLGNPPARLVAN